jgi:hypothetical protein
LQFAQELVQSRVVRQPGNVLEHYRLRQELAYKQRELDNKIVPRVIYGHIPVPASDRRETLARRAPSEQIESPSAQTQGKSNAPWTETRDVGVPHPYRRVIHAIRLARERVRIDAAYNVESCFCQTKGEAAGPGKQIEGKQSPALDL